MHCKACKSTAATQNALTIKSGAQLDKSCSYDVNRSITFEGFYVHRVACSDCFCVGIVEPGGMHNCTYAQGTGERSASWAIA
jgi:hypothetical protein